MYSKRLPLDRAHTTHNHQWEADDAEIIVTKRRVDAVCLGNVFNDITHKMSREVVIGPLQLIKVVEELAGQNFDWLQPTH
eukprot:9990224-Ditylum_brightwellii.AAC.1